jgi:hypothetical protein
MTVTATPIYPQTIYNSAARISSANGTNLVTVADGGSNGTIIEFLNISLGPSDGNRNVRFYYYNPTANANIVWTTVEVAESSGDSGDGGYAPVALTFDKLNATSDPVGKSQFQLPTDANGNPYLYIPENWELRANVDSSLSTANVDIIVFGGQY